VDRQLEKQVRKVSDNTHQFSDPNDSKKKMYWIVFFFR